MKNKKNKNKNCDTRMDKTNKEICTKKYTFKQLDWS